MNVADGMTELVKQYGPAINVRVLWADMYFTCSPEHIKSILATGFDNHVKGMCLVSRSYRL